jgi:hypothetical protein
MNLRAIENSKVVSELLVPIDSKWIERTKGKIKELINNYIGKSYSATNLIDIQNDMQTLLHNESGIKGIELEVEVGTQGKLLFNGKNDQTKELIAVIYTEKTEGSADGDMQDHVQSAQSTTAGMGVYHPPFTDRSNL